MPYAAELSGNVERVKQNAATLQKGLDVIHTMFTSKLRHDDTYAQQLVRLARTSVGDYFCAQDHAWHAVQEFKNFLSDQGERVAQNNQVLHSQICMPLRNMKIELADWYATS